MLDLSTPALRQADILQAIPGLKEKSLQNWYQRKILRNNEEAVRSGLVDSENPGRQAKRLANAYGFLVIATMYEMGQLWIDPADAREIGFKVAQRADELNETGKLNRLEIAADDYENLEVWLLTPAKTIQVEDEKAIDLPNMLSGTRYRLAPKVGPAHVERPITGRVKIEIEVDALIIGYLAAALKTPAGVIISSKGAP
ncbi:MAG: hypothetical protein LCH88_17320 [Proteobacteria bacterium]|nr:hypothetical protein [Pseudomonadota bacterium]